MSGSFEEPSLPSREDAWILDGANVAKHESSQLELSVAHRTFLAIVLTYCSGIVLEPSSLLTSTPASAVSGALLDRVVKTAFYAYTAVVLVRHRSELRLRVPELILAALVSLAVFSTLWSDAPSFTLMRSGEVWFTTAFAVQLALRFPLKQQVHLLALACAIVVAVTVLSAVIFPEYGVMHGEFEGAWRGLFSHKNQLGRFGVLGTIIFTAYRAMHREQRFRGTVGIISCIALIILSTSRSALVSIVFLAGLLPLFASFRSRRSLLVPYLLGATAFVAASGWWVYEHIDKVLELLGRDITLSGRTALWFAVISFISQRPLLGYGYAAFWRGWNGNSAFISLALNWEVPHSHNGWLDVGLDVGLVGLGLMCLLYLLAWRRTIQQLVRGDQTRGIWMAAGLTYVFLANATESALLKSNNIFWILFVLVLVVPLTRRRNEQDAQLDGLAPAVIVPGAVDASGASALLADEGEKGEYHHAGAQ